jgi:5-formyltetrahydrofolate cyclo-ligase
LRHDRTVRPAEHPLAVLKSALRRDILLRRRSLGPAATEAAGRALANALLPACRSAGSVAAYAAVGSEPPTWPLLEGLAGVRVLLPVLLADGDLDWAEHRPDAPLVRTDRGLLEPAGPRLGPDAVASCGVVLVPALAVDAQGGRLGRGGGSYDRALPRSRGLVVALLHDGELVDAVPAEPHDVRVDAAATPSGGLVRLTPSSDRRTGPGTMEP